MVAAEEVACRQAFHLVACPFVVAVDTAAVVVVASHSSATDPSWQSAEQMIRRLAIAPFPAAAAAAAFLRTEAAVVLAEEEDLAIPPWNHLIVVVAAAAAAEIALCQVAVVEAAVGTGVAVVVAVAVVAAAEDFHIPLAAADAVAFRPHTHSMRVADFAASWQSAEQTTCRPC